MDVECDAEDRDDAKWVFSHGIYPDGEITKIDFRTIRPAPSDAMTQERKEGGNG
jgi:hypothetical protein